MSEIFDAIREEGRKEVIDRLLENGMSQQELDARLSRQTLHPQTEVDMGFLNELNRICTQRARKEEISKFCEELAEQWKKVPYMRFGQLVVNALGMEPFDVEDSKAIECIKEFVKWVPSEEDTNLSATEIAVLEVDGKIELEARACFDMFGYELEDAVEEFLRWFVANPEKAKELFFKEIRK